MVIVEGCDNAGKTTLVQRLSDELKLLTVLNRRRPRSLQQSWDYLTRIMPAMAYLPTVVDRFMAVSEPIYGPICRGERLYSLADIVHQFKFVTKSLGDHPPLLVYCRPSNERILNFGDRPQMAGVIQNAQALIEAYDGQIGWLRDTVPLPVVRYDFDRGGAYEQVKQAVIDHISKVY